MEKVQRITSSTLQKNFGKYREVVQYEPVVVTSNGRDSAALISMREFAAYQEFKKSRYAYNGEVTDEFKEEIRALMEKHEAVLERLAQ